MKSKSLFEYFFFGTSVRYLEDAQAGTRIHDDDADNGWYILSNIDQFYEQLQELNLQVTSRACDKLRSLYYELENAKKDSVLSPKQASRLSQVMRDIRKTLEAELKGFLVYTVTPKRIDVTKLLSDVSYLFSPSTYGKLPEIARYDLAESGKCIAYELPTAAAFHLMRATEAVIRAFLSTHLGKSDEKLWGPMIKQLRTKLTDTDHIILLNNLDNIRVSFRNPTQHPEKVYDIQEVQDLWGLCVDAINRMARDLPKVAE